MLITEDQYLEGLVGAFGTLFSFFFFRRLLGLKTNISVIVGLSFIVAWFIRKMFMNLYAKIKNQPDKTDSEIRHMKKIFVASLILISVISANMIAKKKISNKSKLVYSSVVGLYYFLFLR